MARTNSKYFEYRKNLNGVGSTPTPLKVKIGNSTTLKLGQMARVNTAGFAVPAGVGNAAIGVVTGLIDNNGVPVLGYGYTGQTGHTASGDDTVVTSSTNQTRAVAVFAFISVGLESILYYNDASGDLAQTNLFQLFDVVSTSDQIDQSTASDTNGSYQLVELDPDNDGDLSKGLFRVAEPQLLGYHGNAAAINAA